MGVVEGTAGQVAAATATVVASGVVAVVEDPWEVTALDTGPSTRDGVVLDTSFAGVVVTVNAAVVARPWSGSKRLGWRKESPFFVEPEGDIVIRF